jgi:hypothetical protein
MNAMKNTICSLLAISLLTISCGKKENNTSESASGGEPNEISTAPKGAASAQDSTGTADSRAAEVSTASFSTKGIILAYLKLQDALARDDAKGAAGAGKTLLNEFNKLDPKTVEDKKRADYLDITADAKEHAEHISHNASDIAHQREHMAVLSKDMSDLVTAFGSETKLYQAHCPMYNEGKGAVWLSAGRDIRNPYYGEEMLACGSIKKEF